MNSAPYLALLSLLLCAPAKAQDHHGVGQGDIEVGDALVCETQEQIERYVALYKGDEEAAIRDVNREERDPRACGVMSVAFVRGPRVAAASHGNMAFEIVRILILGVDSSGGLHAVQPAPYFTAFGVTEYPV